MKMDQDGWIPRILTTSAKTGFRRKVEQQLHEVGRKHVQTQAGWWEVALHHLRPHAEPLESAPISLQIVQDPDPEEVHGQSLSANSRCGLSAHSRSAFANAGADGVAERAELECKALASQAGLLPRAPVPRLATAILVVLGAAVCSSIDRAGRHPEALKIARVWPRPGLPAFMRASSSPRLSCDANPIPPGAVSLAQQCHSQRMPSNHKAQFYEHLLVKWRSRTRFAISADSAMSKRGLMIADEKLRTNLQTSADQLHNEEAPVLRHPIHHRRRSGDRTNNLLWSLRM